MTMKHYSRTAEMLIKHYQTYPELQAEDIFKYIYQSAFGCEHLVTDYTSALEYIKTEYADIPQVSLPLIEKLDGAYSRVHLSCLNEGLCPETLAKIFCASSKKEATGTERIREMLQIALELVREGLIALNRDDFEKKATAWAENGFKALHHSESFRAAYHPSYRVVSNEYVKYLRIFSEIDKRCDRDYTTVAIEGGSASGKTTLSGILSRIYDCNVFHMDDFFLRPEQRTAQRFAEVGGNLDRERFAEEVLEPLKRRETVQYRPFNCSTQTLGDTVTVSPKKLTVIEGVYSLHPTFGNYCDLSFFLDISPEEQRTRILKRNPPFLATRFFNEWIPMENTYFSETNIRNRVDTVLASE